MFDNFCSFFSNIAQPGSYSYQAYKKIPQAHIFNEANQRLSKIQNQNTMQNIVLDNNIPNLTYNPIGFNPINVHNRANINQLNNIINSYIRNIPQNAVKANQSNLQRLTLSNSNCMIKQILKSNYLQIIKQYQGTNKKFTDLQFQPSQKSIGNVQGLTMNAQWKRISEIIRNPSFINQKIIPSKILQGSIGDYYFLSPIAALAEYDFRIKNLFPQIKVNQNGIYMARIMYKGVIRQVVVDDYVPITSQGVPLFTKPINGNQIWIMILQKCWAKLHGSYGAIVGGLPNQLLRALSRAPTFYKPIHQNNKQKQQILWKQINEAYYDGAIICCSTKGDSSIQKAGLVLGHSYSINKIFNNPYRLMKIRNPWKKRQWNGRASQQDIQFWSTISPIDKQNLGYLNGNDGSFFILWEDFINYFDMIDICRIKDNANYLNINVQFNKKRGQIFQIQTAGGNVFLTLSQQNLRGFGKNQQKNGYSRSTIIVARHDEASKGYEYKYVDSSSSKLSSEHIIQLKSLQAGKYVVFVKFDWLNKSVQTGTIGIYMQTKCSIKRSSQSNHPQFLYKVFLDHARKNKKKQILSQQPKQWICSQFLLNKSGYGYLAIHLDQKSSKKIGIQINQKQYTQRRLTLKKPYKGEGIIKTMIQPGKELIVLFRMKAHNYPSTITLPTPKIYNLTE